MKKLFTFFNACFCCVIFTTFAQKVEAQDFGADVASSYVWRGTNLGTDHTYNWMSLGYGNLELELG